MDFRTWLSTLPGAPTPSIAAKAADLAGPTLLRHASRGHSTADNIITIARAFGVPPVDALVLNGFLEEYEVSSESISVRKALAQTGIDDALRLLIDKVEESGLFEVDFTSDGVNEEEGPGADLHRLPTPEDEPEPYAANRRKPEPVEGDDDYGPGA